MKNFKSILITGASSGIGEALAISLSSSGVYLSLSGRDQSRLQAVAEKCRTNGAVVDIKIIDVCDAKSMKEWIVNTDTAHPFDLIIANAGVSPGTSGETETDAQLRRMTDVNVIGVLNTLAPVIPRMIDRKTGNIAVVSSLAGFRGLPSAPGYGASKAWVRSYGEGLRGRLFGDGITVSVICPGFVASRITDQNEFHMPFYMDAPKAATIILTGLKKGKARIAFPFPMYAMVWLLSVLPLWFTDKIFSRLPSKE